MKKTIKLNEKELHRLISESVKRVLNETSNDDYKLDIEGIVNNISDNFDEFVNEKSYKINDTLEIMLFLGRQMYKVEIWDHSSTEDMPNVIGSSKCIGTGEFEDDILNCVYQALEDAEKHKFDIAGYFMKYFPTLEHKNNNTNDNI